MQIDIIGRGNVGWHLLQAFAGKADVVSVDSKSLAELRLDADIYIISVSDNAIEEIARRLNELLDSSRFVAHTSGTMPLDALDSFFGRTGVFYPLQTFSKNVNLDYREIPIFIESHSPEDESLLSEVAGLISNKVIRMDSQRRKDLHIASVLSCNFVNHLWTLAERYLNEKEIDFSLLRPLIEETTRKLKRLSPYDGQTGPAVRHDNKTISSHLQQLSDYPEISGIYTMLTESIESLHPKK